MIPSIEEIYSYYHSETMYVMKGFYPKKIVNFEKCINDSNIEMLRKFQRFIERNKDIINWKLYIIALSKYFKRRFDLKILGSLAGNKIYRQYINFIDEPDNLSDIDIKNEITNSLIYFKNLCKNENISFNEYLKIDINTVPLAIKDIYSGKVSKYFYSCFYWNQLIKFFFYYSDDIFYEFFNVSKNEFIELLLYRKKKILKYDIVRTLVQKVEEKFIK